MKSGRYNTLIYTAIAILWVVIVVRLAANRSDEDDFVVTAAQADVQAFAHAELNAMQARSFAEKVELCAIIYEDSDGALGTSRLLAGDEATCDLRYFDKPGMAPLASIHTHGAFDENYDSEVPSLIDLEGDIADGLDGYVATPGGRLWWIDWREERAVLVCREGCLQQDPAYRPCRGDDLRAVYTLSQLAARNRDPMAEC
jgi:Domain of unknown function (DUF4329)